MAESKRDSVKDFMIKFVSGVVSAVVILYASSYANNSIETRSVNESFFKELEFNKTELTTTLSSVNSVSKAFTLDTFVDRSLKTYPSESFRIIQPDIRSTFYDKAYETGVLFELLDLSELYALSDIHKDRLNYKISKINKLFEYQVDIEKYNDNEKYRKQVVSKYKVIDKKLSVISGVISGNINSLNRYIDEK
ncbi:hypothetical protein P3531_16955 [Vibrio parahaemolyticus]|nr:hypothetical protein [Vibrio vulnificus]MDF4734288.1 hypothetical protein [Vibrio parahaemolyticus]MDG2604259.1 hypothetical protein [Vibrio parahaemolyticus]